MLCPRAVRGTLTRGWTPTHRVAKTSLMHDDDADGDGRDETPEERADRNWDELMQELRVLQTGTQVLSGFLLAVAFQPRFADLDGSQVFAYLVLVVLAALATILAFTPVVLHRALFGRRRKPDLVRYAATIVRADLFVIGALTVGVLALIVDVTVQRTVALIVLGVATVAVVALWGFLPRFVGKDTATR